MQKLLGQARTAIAREHIRAGLETLQRADVRRELGSRASYLEDIFSMYVPVSMDSDAPDGEALSTGAIPLVVMGTDESLYIEPGLVNVLHDIQKARLSETPHVLERICRSATQFTRPIELEQFDSASAYCTNYAMQTEIGCVPLRPYVVVSANAPVRHGLTLIHESEHVKQELMNDTAMNLTPEQKLKDELEAYNTEYAAAFCVEDRRSDTYREVRKVEFARKRANRKTTDPFDVSDRLKQALYRAGVVNRDLEVRLRQTYSGVRKNKRGRVGVKQYYFDAPRYKKKS